MCCTSIFDLGHSILDVALCAINDEACVASPCEFPGMDGIVTVGDGRGYADVDLMTVALQSLRPDSQQAKRQSTRFVASWQIQFVESNWLTFVEGDNNEIVPADPGLIQLLASYSYSHAEQVYRAVLQAILEPTSAIIGCGRECGATVGPLFPLQPSGHTVGWQFLVDVPFDMSRNCSGVQS